MFYFGQQRINQDIMSAFISVEPKPTFSAVPLERHTEDTSACCPIRTHYPDIQSNVLALSSERYHEKQQPRIFRIQTGRNGQGGQKINERPESLNILNEYSASIIEILDHTRLSGHREFRLAHLQLCIISSGYIWQDGDDGVPEVLPACLSVPLCGISDVLGIQPILAHVDIVLANYQIIDPERPISLGNIRCICHLPGGKEADWFVLTTVQIEANFVEAIEPLLRALQAADKKDPGSLIDALRDITTTIHVIKKSLQEMNDGLSASTFYDVTRPFLSGWGGEGSPLPNGIIYEGVSDKPKMMIGGSAAQSSSFQSIDAVLHITHKPEIQEFFHKMRYHMPPLHKKFIEECYRRSNVKQYVYDSDNPSLKAAYDVCIQSMVDLRSYHIQIVTKYIVVMSNRKNKNEDYRSVSKKGTGGSSILPFLKSVRETTKNTKALSNNE